jgi:hypothetical protein
MVNKTVGFDVSTATKFDECAHYCPTLHWHKQSPSRQLCRCHSEHVRVSQDSCAVSLGLFGSVKTAVLCHSEHVPVSQDSCAVSLGLFGSVKTAVPYHSEPVRIVLNMPSSTDLIRWCSRLTVNCSDNCFSTCHGSWPKL